jgi:acyl carrier protein phosphodiesterase
MGDFVKGPLAGRYPEALMQGLMLHRRIDTFTDAHPVVHTSRARVGPERRRFAGIMVDMFYDHFLARNWGGYSTEPLQAFTGRVYGLLSEHHAILPGRLQQIAPRMAELDWLGSYQQVDAIHAALDRMGQRLKRGNRLLGAAEELTANYAALEGDFRTFFPDVVRFARELRGE